jgi:hypothetical protein
MASHPADLDDDAVGVSRHRPQKGSTPSSSADTPLLDALLDGYIDWRNSARAVANSYAQWSCAPTSERVVRFAAYTACLDQEQKTAAAYADVVTDVERLVARMGGHRGL